jgi:hypothetical protein
MRRVPCWTPIQRDQPAQPGRKEHPMSDSPNRAESIEKTIHEMIDMIDRETIIDMISASVECCPSAERLAEIQSGVIAVLDAKQPTNLESMVVLTTIMRDNLMQPSGLKPNEIINFVLATFLFVHAVWLRLEEDREKSVPVPPT